MVKTIKYLILGSGLFVIPLAHAESDIQPINKFLETYFQDLIRYSCDKGMDDTPADKIISEAAQGVNKNTVTFNAISNIAKLGIAMGHKLKNGPIVSNDVNKHHLGNCADTAKYISFAYNIENGIVKSIHRPLKENEGKIQSDAYYTQLANKMFIADSPNATAPQKAENVYSTTAKQLAMLYEENEVAADDKIGGRPVAVKGVVKSIDKDFTNSVVIHMESNNTFMPVSLRMSDTEKSRAAKLRKGETITITCKRMAFVIGSPSGSDCEFN